MLRWTKMKIQNLEEENEEEVSLADSVLMILDTSSRLQPLHSSDRSQLVNFLGDRREAISEEARLQDPSQANGYLASAGQFRDMVEAD